VTNEEFDTFLENTTYIEWLDDEENKKVLFRNTELSWYINDEKRATAVDYAKVREMTPYELLVEINRGLEVEGITRVTGYFAKVKSFNKGKLGELRARTKHSIGQPQGTN